MASKTTKTKNRRANKKRPNKMNIKADAARISNNLEILKKASQS